MSAPAAAPHSHSTRRWESAGRLGLLAATALAYAPVLWNGLVWDDVLHIADNPHMSSVGAATVYLQRLEGPYYRPLVFLAYAAERSAWGTAAIGYHAVNLILHLANVWLLMLVARRTGAGEAAVLIGAALFALHPVQSEAVAYVSGRTDLLMMTGALLSCAALLGSGPPLVRGIVMAAGGLIAVLSKETGYALLLVWPWLAWRHIAGPKKRLLVVPAALTTLVLLVLRPGDVPVDGATVSTARVGAVGQALLTYAGVVIWPGDLHVDRLTMLPQSGLAIAGGLVALGAAIALAAWGMSRRGSAADWAAWTLAFYLPAANLVALYPAIADRAVFTPEHNLYAPLAGIGMLAGLAAARAGVRLPVSRRRVAAAVLFAIFIILAARTTVRCVDWRDEERLFGAAVAAGTESPRVWYNYGNALLQRGADADAVAVFTEAARRAPNDARIWTNLGVAAQRRRDYDAAERAYWRAAELTPDDAQIFENLGSLYAARGNLVAARAAFATALRLDPKRTAASQALRAIDDFEQR